MCVCNGEPDCTYIMECVCVLIAWWYSKLQHEYMYMCMTNVCVGGVGGVGGVFCNGEPDCTYIMECACVLIAWWYSK